MASRHIRVLHVLSALKTGGINSSLLQNIEHMGNASVQHHVCSIGRVEEDWARAYRVLGVAPFSLGHTGRRTAFRTLWRLVCAIRERSANVVHAHFPLAGVYGALATFALGVPLVCSVHSNRRSPRAEGIKREIMDRLSFRCSTRVIAVSDAVAQSCVRQRGASRNKVEVIYNGVDTSKFGVALSQEAKSRARASLPVAPSAPIVLNVGRLSSVKSQDTLIPMMEHLRSEVPKAVLLIAGEGPMRPKLETLIRKAGLRDRAHLLGLRRDIPTLMKIANVFVLPSISEGFSITLLEAMASGLPVVASDIAPNRRALDDGAAGKLVSVGDPRHLAQSIAAFLQKKDVAQKVGKRGRCRAVSKFDVRETAGQIEDSYLRVIGKPREKPSPN